MCTCGGMSPFLQHPLAIPGDQMLQSGGTGWAAGAGMWWTLRPHDHRRRLRTRKPGRGGRTRRPHYHRRRLRTRKPGRGGRTRRPHDRRRRLRARLTDSVRRSRPSIRRSLCGSARFYAAKRTGVRGGAEAGGEACPLTCADAGCCALSGEWHRISTPATWTGEPLTRRCLTDHAFPATRCLQVARRLTRRYQLGAGPPTNPRNAHPPAGQFNIGSSG
jgi:hypothetical protein